VETVRKKNTNIAIPSVKKCPVGSAVGDIGASLTPEVWWCEWVHRGANVGVHRGADVVKTKFLPSWLWLKPDLKYHQKQRVNFVRVRW